MHLLLAFFSLSLGAVARATQEPFSLSDETPILSARLDSAIENILKEFQTPGGVGVAVVRKTAQGTWHVESKGYGNATAQGDKVTADTLFAIGSNSKVCGCHEITMC
jgi:CubicO group peptidase (beta-lactamase class C family)